MGDAIISGLFFMGAGAVAFMTFIVCQMANSALPALWYLPWAGLLAFMGWHYG